MSDARWTEIDIAEVTETTPVPHPTSRTRWPPFTPAKRTRRAAHGVVNMASGPNNAQPARWAALKST